MELNNKELHAAMTKALFDSLSEEVKNKLIKQSLDKILEPTVTRENDRYGAKVSLLQIAFEEQVQRQATSMVEEMIKSDEGLRAKIRAVVDAGIAEAFSDQHMMSVYANRVARSIHKALFDEKS
jgi:hypothetical protein